MYWRIRNRLWWGRISVFRCGERRTGVYRGLESQCLQTLEGGSCECTPTCVCQYTSVDISCGRRCVNMNV